MSDELLKKILDRIDSLENNLQDRMSSMESRLENIEKNTLTIEQSIQVAETLENIAVESAAAVEDKAEAGYVILNSLFNGLTKQMNERFDQVAEQFARIEKRLDKQDQQLDAITETLKSVNDLLALMVQKDQEQDNLIQLFDRRLKRQEQLTFNIQKKLKELGGGNGQ